MPDPTPCRRLASIDTAADYLDVEPTTIRRYITAGLLIGYRVGPKLIRVDLNEVDGLLHPVGAGAVARP